MKRSSLLSISDLENRYNLDYINTIWCSIMMMSTEFLNIYLKPGVDYEDIGKKAFVNKLAERFEHFRELGDTELLMDLDTCHGCNCLQPVCKFIGNKSGNHFALFFEIEGQEIVDIYHCNWYGEQNISLN
ncbi:hypothetical protein BTO09_06495 [Gilvibacter sp. SZ-19]|uniref:hypothetical protein n=1 Tax=Gilvibacter sp. SZ-19 TaxID=754429 RepID=UPI000B3C190F|nr:hypothetical protein [Gilvibacter sp. SZ-19]ARV12016.1 hypothetical protein BTO09_06495 [Gilvibacter sp. SZ-19]